jgi:hypothetical protein
MTAFSETAMTSIETITDLTPVLRKLRELKIPLFDGLGLAVIVVQMHLASPAQAHFVVDTRCSLPSTSPSSILPWDLLLRGLRF